MKNRVDIIVVNNVFTGKNVPLSIATELRGNFISVTCVHYERSEEHLEAWYPQQDLNKETYGEVQEDLLKAVERKVKYMSERELNDFEEGSIGGNKIGIKSHVKTLEEGE